ncbi:glycosyltransferase family 4 protein [Citrobacter sp. RHBSTW-00271]|uniref:glycosyltransferase family 4 protein n=1 Tax=Citrobacter sp. RHBSTW-00271 TaxID=2742642 RepID=UPI0015FCCCE7|nr:glycosyltransferase family 4 protein [Citrobacter sp. RHBSTW-00271]MBA7944157.1 glycosyltransferase family 4 protein [Citrobacter sp. RHBSTW-00271]
MGNRKYDVTLVLSYYYPYVSGLTNVARDLAEELAKRGKKVAVIATQHAKDLPLHEVINGVEVIRTPVILTLGKGVISPRLISTVSKISKKSKIINIHSPMLEAGVIAKVAACPVVTTYQCDISLPPTFFGKIQNKIMDLSTMQCIKNSRYVTVSSNDYINSSRISCYLEDKRVIIPPTCHLRSSGEPTYREGHGMHIGFLGRIVEEKGIEYLVDGFRNFGDPDARLLIAGDFSNIAGGSVIERVKLKIGDDHRIKLLGFLDDVQLNNFYASIDVFALPSVNPFEAFGIVQVEAMMLGIPVIASDMPGVRQPVKLTGMGVIVRPRDAKSITEALYTLFNTSIDKNSGIKKTIELYSLRNTIDKFENIFISCETA